MGPAVILCVLYSGLERRLENLETRVYLLLLHAGCLSLARQGVSTCVHEFTGVSLSEGENH